LKKKKQKFKEKRCAPPFFRPTPRDQYTSVSNVKRALPQSGSIIYLSSIIIYKEATHFIGRSEAGIFAGDWRVNCMG
jgi:hypothetical protein